MPTYAFSSGTVLDQGYALPSGPVGAALTRAQFQYFGLTSSTIPSSPVAYPIFTPEGSSSYVVVGATAAWNVVGSQPLYLTICSGGLVQSGVAICASAIPTGPASVPVYANLIASTALCTIAPGQTLGLRQTAAAAEPLGMLEVVLMRI